MKGPPVTWDDWGLAFDRWIQDLLLDLAESPPPADSPLGRLRRNLTLASEEYEKHLVELATQDTERMQVPKP